MEPKFKDPKIRAKYGKNGLNWKYFRQENHNYYVKEHHPEYLSYDNQEDLIIFVINGNQGSYEQFPIIINCLENYTNFLTETEGKETSTHYNPIGYGYDFGLVPHVFSKGMFDDQAEYVA